MVALPLAPFLHREHPLVLVLLRPTKEVLLWAGFLVRRGELAAPLVVAAAVPLAVVGVWTFFGLGRAYRDDLRDNDHDLPGFAGRVLRPERVRSLCRVLTRRGARVVVLGRLAVFPSSMVAAAAGVAGLPARRFLVADGIGAALAIGEVMVAGYVLGATYERGGPLVTAMGAGVAAALLVALGRWLRRDDADDADPDDDGDQSGAV